MGRIAPTCVTVVALLVALLVASCGPEPESPPEATAAPALETRPDETRGQGVAWGDRAEMERALRAYDETIATRSRLVDEEGRRDLVPELASALNNRGLALRTTGRPDQAVRDYTRAIELRAALFERDGRQELAGDLAASLSNRAVAQGDLGRLDRAVEDYDRAIEIQTRLVEADGRRDLANDLAGTLNNRGTARNALGDPARALPGLRPGDRDPDPAHRGGRPARPRPRSCRQPQQPGHRPR